MNIITVLGESGCKGWRMNLSMGRDARGVLDIIFLEPETRPRNLEFHLSVLPLLCPDSKIARQSFTRERTWKDLRL